MFRIYLSSQFSLSSLVLQLILRKFFRQKYVKKSFSHKPIRGHLHILALILNDYKKIITSIPPENYGILMIPWEINLWEVN